MLASVVCLLSVIARRLTPLAIMVRERTFIAVKPDGVQRGLIGEIIKRFEAKGFKLAGMKYIQVSTGTRILNPCSCTSLLFFAYAGAGNGVVPSRLLSQSKLSGTRGEGKPREVGFDSVVYF